MMKNVEEQLSSYKSVHFNKKNIQTHFVGIPLIILAVTILLSIQQFEMSLMQVQFSYSPAIVFFTISLIYYFILHWRLALGMLVYLIPNIYIASLIAPMEGAYTLAIVVFIIGWVIQFMGHYYEKAKPAFIDDLSQFLIGPFFLMAEVYFACGWEKPLNGAITPLAIEKRRMLERNTKENK